MIKEDDTTGEVHPILQKGIPVKSIFSKLIYSKLEDKSHDEEHYKNQKQKEQRNFQLFSGKSMFIDTFQC